jgi:hypothetical protein
MACPNFKWTKKWPWSSRVKNRNMPFAIFYDHNPTGSLLTPAKTRFATNYIMLHCLLQVRGAFKQVVIDERWKTYTRTLRDNNKGKPRTISRDIKRFVQDEQFWTIVENFCNLVQPVVNALRDFDGKTPCMGKIWQIMKNLSTHVEGLGAAPFKFREALAHRMLDEFNKWKEMVTMDLHYTGALLNPYLSDKKTLAEDNEANHALKRVFKKLCLPENYGALLTKYHNFKYKLTPFDTAVDPRFLKNLAHM